MTDAQVIWLTVAVLCIAVLCFALLREPGAPSGMLTPRQVHRALRKRYVRTGYRIHDDGSIEVHVRFASGNGLSGAPDLGHEWWGPFGNLNDAHTHRALANILSE